MTNQKLKDHYVNPILPGSYSGFETFFRALKASGLNEKRNTVKEWMKTQDAYTLHRPIRRRFKRNKVIVAGIDDTWQIDLVDMGNIAKHNDGIRYIITCIDVFSKFAWTVPVKNKDAQSVLNGFSTFFNGDDDRIPKQIQADKGSEFFNAKFKKYLKNNNINLYSVNCELKACVVERFNRTLKEKMYRYFTARNTYRYLDILDDLIISYNKTYHRTIKMAPFEVCKENESDVWRSMYGLVNDEIIKFKFNVDDKVRISKNKNIFEKGYTPNWTEEVFIITTRMARVPPVYQVKDLNDTDILGVFYEKELQSVNKKDDEEYRIEKILKKRKRKGKLEYFVRWLGYTPEFDSWVSAEDIKQL